jgi:hypothetical protein
VKVATEAEAREVPEPLDDRLPVAVRDPEGLRPDVTDASDDAEAVVTPVDDAEAELVADNELDEVDVEERVAVPDAAAERVGEGEPNEDLLGLEVTLSPLVGVAAGDVDSTDVAEAVLELVKLPVSLSMEV